MRLKGKLIVMFLAVAIVPLSAIVAVGTYRLENALMENALGQLDAVATIQEARISDAVVANTNAIRAFKTRLQLKTELAKYTQDGSAQSLGFINSLIKDVKSQLGYRDIHILDARGRIVASTDPGMVGANYSHEYAFARGMVAEDPTIVFKDRDGRLGLRLAGPLELNGTLIGVALIETDAENLLLPLREYAGLGETGESQLVKPLDNGDALYITPLRFYPDAALSLVEPRENADRPIIQALNKTEKIFTSALDYRGHEVLAVSKYIESAGWGLVVKKDKSEAFKPVEDLVYASLAVGILVIFFAVALSLFFAGSISRPISQLSSAMKELKRGNFKARVDIKTNDEFQELGESFNMAVRLAGQESEHKRLDRMKSEFLTMAGHELRSPMTPMRAQLQMLLAGYFGRIRARQKEALEIILRNSIRLDSIIRDFLEISRLETARLSFNFAKGDLRPHIKNVVREMEAFMPERGVSISLETGKLPAIEADTDRVSQVLRNLLSNAIKFSKEKGKVAVTVSLEGDHVLFSVSDNGKGISSKGISRIFEPFFQEEDTILPGQYRGIGLGLTICKGIVEAQEGRIWVESRPGKGTTFYFTLPLEPVRKIKPMRLLFSAGRHPRKNPKELFKEAFITKR